MPHDHGHVLADWHKAGRGARRSRRSRRAAAARREWASWPLGGARGGLPAAAELLATTWRATLNAATMLGQSKTVFQAEIDAACELIDFWRFNVHFAQELYDEQPLSPSATWNRLDYRPLEGFVFAVTPFNFTVDRRQPADRAGAAWATPWSGSRRRPRCSRRYYIMKLLEAAGLPPGVINFVPGDGPRRSADVVLDHRDLAGVHFTGSHRRLPTRCGSTIGDEHRRATAATRGSSARPAARTSSSRTRRADPAGARRRRSSRGALRVPGPEVLGGESRVYVPRSLWPRRARPRSWR